LEEALSIVGSDDVAVVASTVAATAAVAGVEVAGADLQDN
jgi:hypothetical protein